MNTCRRCIALFSLILIICPISGPVYAEKDDLKAFPPAQAGYERIVIRLDPKPNEADLRLELMIGREMEVDCNLRSLGGSVTRETVVGWGYSYYRAEVMATGPSTLMACPPEEQKRLAFVQVRQDKPLRRYNSKLPVVVYVPKGVEVRYRIWSAGPELRDAIIQ
jgi:ecotin